jgi:hypothetical protein
MKCLEFQLGTRLSVIELAIRYFTSALVKIMRVDYLALLAGIRVKHGSVKRPLSITALTTGVHCHRRQLM